MLLQQCVQGFPGAIDGIALELPLEAISVLPQDENYSTHVYVNVRFEFAR